MKFLLLLIVLFPIFFSQAEIKTSDKEKVQAGTLSAKINIKTELKRTKKSPTKAPQKTASRKAKKKLTLEEVSKSTAFIISGTGKNITTGSGFFITKSLLVTNNHVVENAVIRSNIKVVAIRTQQGIEDIGFVFAEDRENDLAIIKTIKKTHKPLKLGKYNKLKMGDEIFVFGSPQGLVGTLSKGIVSAKRKKGDFQILQITAPISQGSSGSPVLSKDLKVIGIAVGLLTKGQNINFAVPITYLKKLIKANKQSLVKINEMNLEEILKDNTAIKSVESKKPQGSEADFERGRSYYNKKNYKQAVYWLKKAAKQGHTNAQRLLGFLYELGQGVSQDHKKALYWYKKAARQGNIYAQISLGAIYYKRSVSRDYKQAFYWYKKAAEQGNMYAQFSLGEMCFNGKGISQDYKQAFYWYKKSAYQGHIEAQRLLGFLYYTGKGIFQDYKQALQWYKVAANQDDVQAQSFLGEMYYYGKGVPKNFIYAYSWWNLAAANGHRGAIQLRDMVSIKMSSDQIALAQQLSTQIAQEINQRQKSQRGIASE